MYWLGKCAKTENYQWKVQGLDPVAPFPYKPWPIESGKLNQGMLDSLPFDHDLTLNDLQIIWTSLWGICSLRRISTSQRRAK